MIPTVGWPLLVPASAMSLAADTDVLNSLEFSNKYVATTLERRTAANRSILRNRKHKTTGVKSEIKVKTDVEAGLVCLFLFAVLPDRDIIKNRLLYNRNVKFFLQFMRF